MLTRQPMDSVSLPCGKVAAKDRFLLWGAVAEPANQPLGVVGVYEAGDGLAKLIDGVVQLRPQALLF